MEAAKGHGLNVTYVQGYSVKEDDATAEQIAEAVAAAKKAKVAVVFAGLPDAYESEGYDRTHMRMPDSQNRLIEAVAEANPNTVVVLHNGSPVEMPWIGKVKGVLEAYLGGQAVGEATVRVRRSWRIIPPSCSSAANPAEQNTAKASSSATGTTTRRRWMCCSPSVTV